MDLEAVTKSNRRLMIIGIGVIVVIIAATIVLIAVLNPGKKVDMDQFKQLMAAKDKTIEVLQQAQQTLAIVHQDAMQQARSSDQKDSILHSQFVRNQSNYQPINRRYEQIPVRSDYLRSHSDSIAHAFANY